MLNGSDDDRKDKKKRKEKQEKEEALVVFRVFELGVGGWGCISGLWRF